MSDLFNISYDDEGGYERIDISLSLLSFATCTDVWANSEEGREHLVSLILQVNAPRPHEIKRVITQEIARRKVFKLYIQRDPCPVLFFGGETCPICRGPHFSFKEHLDELIG